MKTTINISLIAIASFLISCKKEIQLKLKEKETKVVIEGNITPDKGAEITINKTTAFNNSNTFPEVRGAYVTISDNAGNTEQLNEVSPGKYQGTTLKGASGKTYHLIIKTEDKTYSAISTMPEAINLDTVLVKHELFVGSYFVNAYPIFKDQAGVKNYYRFVQFVNGKRLPGSVIANDDFFDGNYNVQPISNDPNLFKNGDLLELEMQSIDKATYVYFNSLDKTDMGGSAPSNPVSNIEGGALGYFSAHTTQRKSVVVNK